MTEKQHDDEFENLWRNPVTRRRMLQIGGLGLGLAVTGVSLPACTSDEELGQTPDGAPGGSFSAGLASGFLNLNPTTTAFPGGLALLSLIYEKLYRPDPFWPRTELVPELAIEFPRQITPTTYRITLRESATFHDGSTLTADDVVFTLDRVRGENGSPAAARFLGIISAARSVGTAEIEIELSSPTGLLAQRLSLVQGIVSKAAVEASADALELVPVGTGPYRAVAAVSNESATLARFDGYSGSREFNYDQLDIAVVADANARIAGLRSDQLRVAESVPESAFQELSTVDDLMAEAVVGSGATSLFFHCGKPPFDDARVRQAALFAIDRDTITQTSYFGLADPAWGSIVSPELAGSIKTSTEYRFDTDRARQLLAEAGYADEPPSIDILVSDDEFVVSQGPIIEENLAAAGFRPTMIPGAIEAHLSKVTEGNFNAWILFTSVDIYGTADVEFVLRWQYTGSVAAQQLYWQTDSAARVEELLDDALAAPDEAQRARALAAVQNFLQDEVPLAPLHFKRQVTAWSSDLQGFQPMPTVGITLDGVRG